MSEELDKKNPDIQVHEPKKEEELMPPPPKPQDIVKEQEAKLRAKYPGLRGPGSNPLLQKRLSKGQQKYFDSGDYNMAKQSKKPMPPGQKLLLGGGGTGIAHPTPDTIPARKTSLIPSGPHSLIPSGPH